MSIAFNTRRLYLGKAALLQAGRYYIRRRQGIQDLRLLRHLWTMSDDRVPTDWKDED